MKTSPKKRTCFFIFENIVAVYQSVYRSFIRKRRRAIKLFIGLYGVRNKLSVLKKGVGGGGCRQILCLLSTCNVNNFQRNTMLFCNLLHARCPVIGERTLIGVIKNKAVFGYIRVLCIFLKLGRFDVRLKRKIHKIYSAVGCVRNRKTFVRHIFRVGKELSFSAVGRKYANAFFALFACVAYTLVK